jgi:NhaA family Na+:H+ antiporter
MFHKFFHHEASSALLLVVATIGALICANTSLAPTYIATTHAAHFVVNDVLMVIFFFVVGLEIRREIQGGELSSIAQSIIPIGAAVGGMIVPALIYYGITFATPERSGWGIPMATDIAFALGILSLLGSIIPHGLKIFLTSLAIVDDIGAIAVIALFYGEQVSFTALAAVVALAFVMHAARNYCERSHLLFGLFSILVWYCTLLSGVHATVAGIVLAFLVPQAHTLRYEHSLHPYVAFFIMPLFALVNAGVPISFETIHMAMQLETFWGIVVGLVVGKPLGIMLSVVFLVTACRCVLPQHVTLKHIVGASMLAGIGFTMSIFIAGLALDSRLDAAKGAILLASTISAVAGFVVLQVVAKKKTLMERELVLEVEG